MVSKNTVSKNTVSKNTVSKNTVSKNKELEELEGIVALSNLIIKRIRHPFKVIDGPFLPDGRNINDISGILSSSVTADEVVSTPIPTIGSSTREYAVKEYTAKNYNIANYFSKILSGKAPTFSVVETVCPICGEYLDVLTHVHAAKHNLTKEALGKLITKQEANKELANKELANKELANKELANKELALTN